MRITPSGMRISSSVGITSVLTCALVASPAFGYMEYAGMEPGPGLSILQTIAIFVGGPVGIFGLVWFLWSIPSWRRANKPKSDSDWNPTGL